jgi:hypothetical protein
MPAQVYITAQQSCSGLKSTVDGSSQFFQVKTGKSSEEDDIGCLRMQTGLPAAQPSLGRQQE